MTIPIAVDVRFHKWNDILAMPQPDPAMKITTGFWHFARGMALAGTGKLSEAEAEYKIVPEAEQKCTQRKVRDDTAMVDHLLEFARSAIFVNEATD